MQKYKNVSSNILHLDCMTHTIHLSPGEKATLPATRDVRYYSGLKQLKVVKETKGENDFRQLPKFIQPQATKKRPKFSKKLENKVEEIYNNNNNEMEKN